ncbi:MAG: hypothetical protein C0503_00415 [Gemmatimonas sp.]|nr:hypothetical protein [Gemmatimonas sp.]
MRLSSIRVASALAATLAFLSCAEAPTAPQRATAVTTLVQAASVARPAVVISQIQGGGGNAGALYRNDFVELFNPGATPVNLAGWRVAYASSTGSNWNYTALSGSIQPGGYYLVQQAAGTGTQPALPTPDAIGNASMSAMAGKVVLVSAGSDLSGACPVGSNVVDRMGFGAASGDAACVVEWGTRTVNLSNTSSARRKDGGCAYTGIAQADFDIVTQNGFVARNSATPAIAPCDGGVTGPTVASVQLSATSASLIIGATQQLTATPKDADGNALNVAISWTSSAASVATVSSSGLVTAVAAGTATITASAGAQSAQATITVTAAPRAVSPIQLQINELMGDPANAESASWGEWFEVHNTSDAPINLQGWRILSGGSGQPAHTISAAVIVPAGGYAVLGRGFDSARNGGLTLDYNYFTGNSTIWLDNNDYLVLLDATQAIVDSLSWTTLPRGVTKGLRPGVAQVTNADDAAWGFSTTTFGDGDYGTPGAENTGLADAPPFVSPNTWSISGRLTTDTLPVGFEDQLFGTLRDATGATVATTGTWTSLTPDILSIDARGVIRGLAIGTGIVRITAEDGAGRNFRLPVREFAPSSVTYANPAIFGLPVDNDASDDFLLNRREFTSSWNGGRGIPNWVAYSVAAGNRVPGAERCDCFTFDPLLEQAGFSRYSTADYTGAGGFLGQGIGIDRGHLARSADRTVGALDNARTFYFSNIIPQFSDNNQGPWAAHEMFLGDLADSQGKEVFIYAGASGSVGTIKNEGLITIPAWTWKVSVVAAPGTRLEDVRDYRDLQVIAVVMPNAMGIRNVNWQTSYVVTADSVERLSGYRFLSGLPEKTRRALITGTQPPLGAIASVSGLEGAAITFDASASVDPNGSIVSYAWDFGDGTTGSGVAPQHEYETFGTYTVQLVTTDNDGLVDTVSAEISVAQATPAQAALQVEDEVNALVAVAGLNRGETQSLNAKVRAIKASLGRSNAEALLGQLGALENELEAMLRSGRLSEEALRPVSGAIVRLRKSTLQGR